MATRGLGVVANILDSSSFNAGPIINFRFGRDDVDNRVISQLRPLDDALEVGGFASYIIRNSLTSGDNLELSVSLTQDVMDGHGGMLADIGASYFFPVNKKLRLGINTGIDYQSDDYMDAYFGIDANNAQRSGLQQYSADGGFNSASLGGMALYSITPTWGLTGIVQYTRWMGEAADSPIIEQQGNENQVFTALGVTYRF